MSNVLTVLKVVPNEPSMRKEQVEQLVKDKILGNLPLELLRMEEQPLAFGLYATIIYVKGADSEEGSAAVDALQEKLEEMEEIEDVEVLQQTLIHS